MPECKKEIINEVWGSEHLRIISDHPCYDPEAMHKYGRMHLPVAPLCNVKCNFCIRKFDCVNESRPGVTSQILKPKEALKKVEEAINRFPNIKVIGIAGPGDPLYNEETFETLVLIKEEFPSIHLCLSTNGLLLPEKIERIKSLSINTITVTINAVNPEIGKEIYSYIIYNNKTYRGIEGARILLDNQLEGLKRACENRILIKVNTVLIPTINDNHIFDIAKRIKELGVFMMNITPIIPQDKFSHVKPPSIEERRKIQEECGKIIRQMKHCRQCRADAIGLLKEDKSKYFYKNPIRFAVASKDKRMVNEHFGHAKEFHIYDLIDDEIVFIESRNVESYCFGPSECDDRDRLSSIIEMIKDCRSVLCSRIGPDPLYKLLKAGIEPIQAYNIIEDSIKEAAKKLS